MTNGVPSRFGSINDGVDKTALFLKVASGEVLAAFNQAQVMMDRHIVRQISSGKSAQFPVIGRTTAQLHAAGEFINGNQIGHNEIVIPIDGKLISPTEISDLDEAMNHYDVRSIYTEQMGEALANTFDQNVMRCGLLAARDTAELVPGLGAGEVIVDVDADTVVGNLVAALATANTRLTEKRVPKSDRSQIVRPLQYSLLTQSDLVTNRDIGGVGSFGQGVSGPVQGTEVVESINLPNTDESLDTSVIAKYRANYANTVALVMHKSAVGTVKLLDMALETDWEARRQVWLLISKYAMGHNPLRNSAAIEIAQA